MCGVARSSRVDQGPHQLPLVAPDGMTFRMLFTRIRYHAVFRLVGEWEGDVFLKVLDAKGANYNSLRDEAMRLEWLGSRLPVPKVVASGSRGGYEFLLTKAVSGEDFIPCR